MKNKTGPIDFTQGSIVGSMLLFSLPIVMGELLQNLYNSVDALVVGRFVSEGALAAVTVGGVISNMIVNFFNGMSVGSNVVISRAFGAGNRDVLRQKIQTAFTFSVVLGVALSVLGILFAPQLLLLAGAKDDYYQEALLYLRVYLAGLMFTVIYNNGAGILRAVGSSGVPFRILVLSCCTNILLDFLFVGVLPLGVVGVGLATVLAQGMSVVLVYRAINRLQDLRCIDFRELHRNGGDTVLEVLRVGMAAGMQSALISFSNIFVMRYMNLFSTASVAGIGIAQRLDRFIVLPAKSFGITITTFVSQNLGARRHERLQEGKVKCLSIALLVTIGISAAVYLFAEPCVAMFNSSPEVVSVGVSMMRVLIPFIWLLAVRDIYVGILRGNGKNGIPMLLTLTGMVGCRQLFLAIVMRRPKIEYIYVCYPLAHIITTALVLGYYLLVRKRLPEAKKGGIS